MSPYVISLGASIPQAGMASAAVMVGMRVGKVAVGAVCDRSTGVGVALGIGSGIAGCLALAAFNLGFTSGLLLDAAFMAGALGFGLACMHAGKRERKGWLPNQP